MGRPQIIDKIADHLGEHMPPTEECHVLYLLAEIRKFLDQSNPNPKFSALRFYGNWCVHSLLDRKQAFVTKMTPVIQHAIQKHLSGQLEIKKGDELESFLSLEFLKNALGVFLLENKLPTEIIEQANWPVFRTKLFGILSEQPFVEPENGRFWVIFDVNGDGVIGFKADQHPGAIPFTQKVFDK